MDIELPIKRELDLIIKYENELNSLRTYNTQFINRSESVLSAHDKLMRSNTNERIKLLESTVYRIKINLKNINHE